MSSINKAWLFFMLPVFGSLWTLALISHNYGNDTAINALIGIPIGILIWYPFTYWLFRGD